MVATLFVTNNMLLHNNETCRNCLKKVLTFFSHPFTALILSISLVNYLLPLESLQYPSEGGVVHQHLSETLIQCCRVIWNFIQGLKAFNTFVNYIKWWRKCRESLVNAYCFKKTLKEQIKDNKENVFTLCLSLILIWGGET